MRTSECPLATWPREGCEVLRSACCVCRFVCPLTYLKNTCPNFTKFMYLSPVTMIRSSSDVNTMRYVLPVLWMTSCFHITGQIQMQTWSPRRSELFIVTRQVAPLNCAPGGNVVAMFFMQRHVCTVLDDCFFQRLRIAYRPMFASLLSPIALLWPPYLIGQAIIFLPYSFYLLLLLSSFFPRLISAAADLMSTILPHMVWP